MNDMSNLLTKLMLAAVLVGANTTALANPGDGVRLGGSEGRLHPFVEVEGRYDSNAYAGNSTANGGGEAVSAIHVRPGLTLSVPGDMTSVDLTAKLDWWTTLGNSAAAKALDGTIYASAELGISVNKKGTVGLEVNDTFRRDDRPTALTIPYSVSSNYNLLDLAVPFRPGGGALTVELRGGWALESYEPRDKTNCPSPDPACSVSKYGYNGYSGGAGVAWKFLPRTSAILEGEYLKRTPNDTTVSTTGDSSGYRIDTGVTGLVTPHIAATVKVGYGSADTAIQKMSTFLAILEGEWMPTELASVKLGYAHDLNVEATDQYTTNRIVLAAKQLVAGKIALGLTGSVELLSYVPGSETTTILQVSPAVGVEVTRWLKAELAYAYTDRSSSAVKAQTLLDYSKSEVWLKAVATY
jgi:hypothetical protein